MRFAVLLLLSCPFLCGASPTFYRDVLPILQNRCQSCHRPGEIGPMPLETYAQVRPWSKAIREAVVTRTMPPWFADARYGHFANDPTPSAADVATVRAWVEAGSPAGDAGDAPGPKSFVTGWNIGEPEAVLTMPGTFSVPAKGAVDYQYIVIPTGFTEDRWVTAAEVRPSARQAVHHAVVYVRERGSAWLREAKPGVAYVPPEGQGFTTGDVLLVYTPGNAPMQLRGGMAKLIPAGADLVLQIHYTPTGRAVDDQERIGLRFRREAPAQRVLTLQMGQDRLRIPPGERRHRERVEGTLPNDALLLSFFPHMHLRGKSFEYELPGTNGQVETLLRVAPYDFHWQLTYELQTPRLLKAGTRLLMEAEYDNSPNNPNNPDPAAEVTYGEQSWEEMMIGFFDVAVPREMDKPAFFRRGPATRLPGAPALQSDAPRPDQNRAPGASGRPH